MEKHGTIWEKFPIFSQSQFSHFSAASPPFPQVPLMDFATRAHRLEKWEFGDSPTLFSASAEACKQGRGVHTPTFMRQMTKSSKVYVRCRYAEKSMLCPIFMPSISFGPVHLRMQGLLEAQRRVLDLGRLNMHTALLMHTSPSHLDSCTRERC